MTVADLAVASGPLVKSTPPPQLSPCSARMRTVTNSVTTSSPPHHDHDRASRMKLLPLCTFSLPSHSTAHRSTTATLSTSRSSSQAHPKDCRHYSARRCSPSSELHPGEKPIASHPFLSFPFLFELVIVGSYVLVSRHPRHCETASPHLYWLGALHRS